MTDQNPDAECLDIAVELLEGINARQVGSLVYNIRRSLHMGRAEFAALIGRGESTVYAYESGTSSPSAVDLCKMIKAGGARKMALNFLIPLLSGEPMARPESNRQGCQTSNKDNQ